MRNGDVLAAVLNSDIAAYYQDNIKDSNNEIPLTIVHLINLQTQVTIGVPKQSHADLNYTTCEQVNKEKILESLLHLYRKVLKVKYIMKLS